MLVYGLQIKALVQGGITSISSRMFKFDGSGRIVESRQYKHQSRNSVAVDDLQDIEEGEEVEDQLQDIKEGEEVEDLEEQEEHVCLAAKRQRYIMKKKLR